MSRDPVVPAVEAALGSAVVAWDRVSGGDINDAHAAQLADGRWVFVKRPLNGPLNIQKIGRGEEQSPRGGT